MAIDIIVVFNHTLILLLLASLFSESWTWDTTLLSGNCSLLAFRMPSTVLKRPPTSQSNSDICRLQVSDWDITECNVSYDIANAATFNFLVLLDFQCDNYPIYLRWLFDQLIQFHRKLVVAKRTTMPSSVVIPLFGDSAGISISILTNLILNFTTRPLLLISRHRSSPEYG